MYVLCAAIFKQSQKLRHQEGEVYVDMDGVISAALQCAIIVYLRF